MSVAEELQRFHQDALFVNDHWEELTARYADRWIAVYEKEVVASARTPKELRYKLLRKGIDPGQPFRTYLTTKEEDLLIVPLQ